VSLLRRLPPFSTVMVALVLVFLYAPIAIVVVNSFNSNETLVSWGGFTLEWYEQAFGNERVRRDLETSLLIAAVSTGFALLIAVSASLWFRGAGGRGQRILDGTTYMRIILPEVVLAFGLFILLNRFEVTLGIWTVVIGHVTVYSAYATVVIQARLASLSRTLEEAAQDLGAPPRRVFRRVTLPLMMPGVLVAGLLVFTFSFDNVVLSRFLGGAEAETLPVLVLGMIRRNVTPEVNAIGVGIMLVMFVTVALAALVAALRPSPGGSRILGVETTRKEEDS
jgi:ABC-type spermidine/putrescine transport system permease subunit II